MEAMTPAASRYAFCYKGSKGNIETVSPISSQTPKAPLDDLGQVPSSLGPHTVSLCEMGIILGLLLLPKTGQSSEEQNVRKPGCGVQEPTVHFPPNLVSATH